MNASERLQNVQAALTDRGVRDVKFFFDESASGKLPSDVKSEAEFLLGQFLNGETKVISDFNNEELPG